MSRVFVLCIGGTGLRVMKSITMLTAAGLDTNNFSIVPIVVDPHLGLEERNKLNLMLEDYESIYNKTIKKSDDSSLEPLNGFFHSSIEDLSSIAEETLATQKDGRTFGEYIQYKDFTNKDINQCLVKMLFSEKNLINSLDVGFKGSPNVGTMVLGDMIENANWFKILENRFQKGDRIFIISSIFGGTGASGYPLLERKIRNSNSDALKQALMGAVTILPYYSLSKNSASDIDSSTFLTKAKSALSYYENTVKSDYLYYAGETSMKVEYANDEGKQEDKTHFVELIAASALFNFLTKSNKKPTEPQYLTRAIAEDKDTMKLADLGKNYSDIVKCVADFMLLDEIMKILPKEKHFPLQVTRNFDKNFYEGADFIKLKDFADNYFVPWYKELSGNTRAFSPLNLGEINSDFIAGERLEAKDDSYILLEMIKKSNAEKGEKHDVLIRHFLNFAYKAINEYTQKIKK